MSNDQPLQLTQKTDAKASSELIEALMAHVLMATSTAYWNVNQDWWGEPDADNNVERYPPMQLGDILVTHRESEEGDVLFRYHFGDVTVDTWFDSKRMFYHSHLSRDMTRYEMVDWFQRLIDYLHGLTRQSLFPKSREVLAKAEGPQ
jgi:hypothetical protein